MTRTAAPVMVLGSASIHVARFVRGLLAAGERVVVATHGALALEAHPALLEQTEVDLSVLSRSAQRRLRELITRWQPRVVHAHQANSVSWHAVRAGRNSGVPVVVTLWGSDVLGLPQHGPLHRWMVRHALRGAAAWTADARHLLEAAAAVADPGGPALREWIPIGIDDAPPLADVVRERRLLSCRLHKPLYRIDAIVRAFAEIAPRHPGWALEVAASGDQTEALRALAVERGMSDRIEFTGHLSAGQLARAYRRSAIFISVPETDGTSVSLLEAMAAGCLPVLSDLPANREWVQDGPHGRLVASMDSLGAALERAIGDVESGAWERDGRAANARLVDERARFADNIRAFVALYARVVDAGPAGRAPGRSQAGPRPKGHEGAPRGPWEPDDVPVGRGAVMTRVVHVTTVHPRDDIRIFHKECRSLAHAGHEVIQVVGDGRGDAVVDGVRIVDVGAPPAGRLARMRAQPCRALEAVRRLRPALVHFHDPELLPIGGVLAREGLPVIYDAHEDVPRQILTKQWIPAPLRPLLARAFERYENARVRPLAAVVGATPHIAQRFAASARRSVNVGNFPFLDELAPPAAPAGRRRAVCYIGGLTRTRGIRQIVQATGQVPGLQLILCGDMEDAAFEAELRAEPGWAQVDWRGRVGREGVREAMAQCRAGLVTLQPMPSYIDSLPIKMFEYMSAELPVIASDFPMWREIVAATGCGACVDPTDPAAIAAALRTIVDDPARIAAQGRAGRQAVLSTYNWPQSERTLLALYDELLGTAR